MQRLPVSAADLGQSIAIDSRLFGTRPTVQKPGNAKWTLDDLHPMGLKIEDAHGLEAIGARLHVAWAALEKERNGTCCTARSDKDWIRDPQGIHWKSCLAHEADEAGNRPETRHAHGPCLGNNYPINGCI